MKNNLPEVIKSKHPVLNAFNEISQSRSNFQLERFVLGQHDTPEQRYKQVVLEVQTLVVALQKNILELQKLDIRIAKLNESDDPIDKIDATILTIDKEVAEIGISGGKKELEYLLSLWDSFEHKYTAEEIEVAQEEYWTKRLHRQASLEAIGNGGKVNWSFLDALNQIGQLPAMDSLSYAQSQEILQQQVKEIE